jgi:hypothetical protein
MESKPACHVLSSMQHKRCAEKPFGEYLCLHVCGGLGFKPLTSTLNTRLIDFCTVTVLQPCRGEYPGANNLEDDYSIISSKVQYVGQEHGMTTAAATMLVGVANADGFTSTAKLTGIVRSVGLAARQSAGLGCC